MTKIDIISGFLGAGKTTLIKKLLSEALAGSKVVLIENEFGEIGVDGGFLKDAGIEIREMNSGCICCSLVGDFTTSLEEVIEKYAPERILIEPSGVGKLSDVQRAVHEASEKSGVEAGSSVAVVDAMKCKIYMKNFGEFFIDQIEHAGTIVLSRTQEMSEEKLAKVVAMIREHNAEAKIITTPWDDLSGKYILETFEAVVGFEDALLEEFKHEHEHHHHHDHDEDEHHHEHDEHCTCGCHDHDHDEHEHHHDHDEHEHHHDHGEHEHHHDHDEHEHHHDHDEHEHHHDHDEHEHHHDHDEHEHHHDHDEHEHHHDHDEHEHHHDHGEGCTCGCHDHHHHHADDVFTSLGMETGSKYTVDQVNAFLNALENEAEYGLVLRAKGMLPAENGTWIYFDYVPGELNVREGSPEYTGKICVIGAELKEENIKTLILVNKGNV
ncbi:MAG: GTP-binding protein [Lachnospiraceae bacterium]|nr:GTP-binding protein [Lachnospiraceae bacterium]